MGARRALSARRAARRALASQSGLSMVEVLVTALLLVVGLGALIAAFPATSKQTFGAQRLEQAAAIAERELERFRSRDFADLSITAPGHSHQPDGNQPGDPLPNNPEDPRFYVSADGTKFQIKQRYSDQTSGAVAGTPAAGEPLVIESGGLAPSTQLTVADDGIAGTVYRFVTWRDERCGVNLQAQLDNQVGLLSGVLAALLGDFRARVDASVDVLCSATEDTKRVTVAVVLDDVGNRAGPDRPVYVSTVVSDPEAGPNLSF